jgi:hypothetical protein
VGIAGATVSVAAGTAVGAGVAGVPQATRVNVRTTITENNAYKDLLVIFFPPWVELGDRNNQVDNNLN